LFVVDNFFDLGAGKSLVILALSDTSCVRQLATTTGKSLISGSTVMKDSIKLETIVVVPDFIVEQWRSYVVRFTTFKSGEFLVLTKVPDIQSDIENLKRKLLITTPGVYQVLAATYSFSRVVFDEVDGIIIPACKTPQTDMIWCLSSNISKIQMAMVANRGFLRLMLQDFMMLSKKYGHHIWEHIIIQTDEDYLQRSLLLPHFVVREILYIPDIKHLDKDTMEQYFTIGMGAKVYEFFQIKRVHNLDDVYKKLTENKREELYQLTTTMEGVESNQMKSNLLMNEMMAIAKRINETKTCPISFDLIYFPVATFCCQNVFNASPIIWWVGHHGSCPVCRKRITLSDLVAAEDFVTLEYSNKKETFEMLLLEILNELDNRVLIFYNEDTSFVDTLKTNKIMYSEFRGRVQKKISSDFKKGNPRVLSVNSSKYSTGLNLECATHLFLFNEVDDITLRQIIGRAHRIGRTSTLFVLKFKALTT